MMGHTAEAVAVESDHITVSARCACFCNRSHKYDMNGLQAIDKDAEKAVLAYYFKKQEEQKVNSQGAVQALLASSSIFAR